MDKIDEQVKQYIMKGDAGTLTLIDKINELVEGYDEIIEEMKIHKEWHRRFFDKYNKMKEVI